MRILDDRERVAERVEHGSDLDAFADVVRRFAHGGAGRLQLRERGGRIGTPQYATDPSGPGVPSGIKPSSKPPTLKPT